MNDVSNSVEALRLISDWAKWLITIETGAIAITGAVVRAKNTEWPQSVKTFASGAVASFTVSIAVAAVLLLSLPEIAQNIRSDTNIWLTSDSVLGRVFALDTQTLAALESLFFAFGILCFAALILVVIWSPTSEDTTIRENGGRKQPLPEIAASRPQPDVANEPNGGAASR